MTIQVNSKLTKSRDPVEHEFKLENAKGEIVHRLNDGYNLIKFEQFQIKHQVKINSVKKWENVALEWYIHNDDLKIYLYD
jgi:hypothetical protein